MANYFATTGADIVSETNTANGTPANDSIYLQNDITLTSGQFPNLNSPTTAGTLRFRGGTPANYPATGAPANPINYRLTVVDSLNISDTTVGTDQPSFTIGPLTLQIGNGGTAGGIAGNIRVDDGGVIEFNRSVDTTYTGTVSVEDEGNAIVNDVAGTTVTLTGAAGTPGGVAIRASQNTGAADSFELTLGGAGNGVVSGTIIDQNTETNSGALIKTGGGTWTLTGANTYAGGTTLSGGNLVLGNTSAAGTGDITFSTLTGNATARLTLDTAAQVNGVTFGNTIANFNGSSELDLAGLTNASVSFNSTSSLLTVTGLRGGSNFSQSFTLENPTSTAYEARDDGNGGTVVVVCFAAGTRIRTALGERAVESLAVGDFVVTGSGAMRPIQWLGHRTFECRRHPQPSLVMPVRIAANAFGPGRPSRDLLVSPAHAICVEEGGEVLIPAIRLVNGTTVAQVEVESVSYWHVELDSHDILLAEGLPAESYLECGNRDAFANAAVTRLHAVPDAWPEGPQPFCRPFHEDGPEVEAVRARLETRARALGWRLDASPLAGLHLVADGAAILPEVEGLSARFTLPAEARDVRLVSETSVPAHVIAGTSDDRRLGLPVAGLSIDGTPIAVDDPRLEAGFHAVDGDGNGASWRWTDGAALLPASLFAACDGPVSLEVRLAGPALPRWVGPSARVETAPRRLTA
ncbi:hypothetical protein ASG52_18830 [Methylobacterium sp. Leaf456]|uniref:Hint domain-containing protein n=1 Tax=Methylobacterium sp. Leaf456 TaxID=1736382 RepID=UPI0006F28D12|nr:Hint domain-containing protein [Methylobacterium sp. Leaf456]KQT60173.1 hypothetical protein ASG52_18830 [Methylobacterium sp. Leaf456]